MDRASSNGNDEDSDDDESGVSLSSNNAEDGVEEGAKKKGKTKRDASLNFWCKKFCFRLKVFLIAVVFKCTLFPLVTYT